MINEDIRDVFRRVLFESVVHDVEKLLGGVSSMLDPTKFVKGAVGSRMVAARTPIFYWRGKGWFVKTGAITLLDATKQGIMLFKSLSSKRSLSASDVYLHDIPLYVGYDNDTKYLKVDPPVKAKRASSTVRLSKQSVTLTRADKTSSTVQGEVYRQLAATKTGVIHVGSGALVMKSTMVKARSAIKALVKAYPGIEDIATLDRLSALLKGNMGPYKEIAKKYR